MKIVVIGGTDPIGSKPDRLKQKGGMEIRLSEN